MNSKMLWRWAKTDGIPIPIVLFSGHSMCDKITQEEWENIKKKHIVTKKIITYEHRKR